MIDRINFLIGEGKSAQILCKNIKSANRWQIFCSHGLGILIILSHILNFGAIIINFSKPTPKINQNLSLKDAACGLSTAAFSKSLPTAVDSCSRMYDRRVPLDSKEVSKGFCCDFPLCEAKGEAPLIRPSKQQ